VPPLWPCYFQLTHERRQLLQGNPRRLLPSKGGRLTAEGVLVKQQALQRQSTQAAHLMSVVRDRALRADAGVPGGATARAPSSGPAGLPGSWLVQGHLACHTPQPGHTQLQGWQQRRSHRLTGYFRKAALVYAPIGAIHSQAAARAAHAFDVRQFWLMRLHAGECRQALKRAGLAVACTDNYVDTTKRPDAPVHGRQAATHASLCALVTALPARRLGGLDRQPAAGQWRPLQRDGGARAALPDHRAAAGLGGADPAHVLRALRPQLPPAQCARAGHAPALERRSGSSVFVTLFPSCTSAPACCVDSPVRQPT